MPSESVKLFRLAAVEYKASAAATFVLKTDLPGDVLATRETETLPATSGRQVYKFRLAGTTKGRIITVRVTPGAAGTLELYRIGLYVRRIGRERTDWTWHWVDVVPTQEWVAVKVPIPPTPNEYTAVKVPIPPTPDEYSQVKVPVPATPHEYTSVKIPIPPTSDDYTSVKLPIEESPERASWFDFPMDDDQPVTGAV